MGSLRHGMGQAVRDRVHFGPERIALSVTASPNSVAKAR